MCACYLPLRDEVRPDAEDGRRPIGEVSAVETSLSTARVTVHRTTVTATIRRPSFASPCSTHTQCYLLEFRITLPRLPQIAVIFIETAVAGSV
jgi:hypothetical protein